MHNLVVESIIVIGIDDYVKDLESGTFLLSLFWSSVFLHELSKATAKSSSTSSSDAIIIGCSEM